MSSSRKHVAKQVHKLLLSARPERDDPNLITAALFQSSVPTSPSLVKDQTFIAIKKLQTAIKKGASADDGETLLLDAIHAAEKWTIQEKRGIWS